MLDALIRRRAAALGVEQRQRLALTLQKVARFLAIPAFSLMLIGLILHLPSAPRADSFPGDPVVPVGDLIGAALLSPDGSMSLGLLLLALIPLATVLLILIDRMRLHQWMDAAIGAGVAAILMLSILLGRK